MIELLLAHARRRGWEVIYSSRVSLGPDTPAGRLGGWDARRQQIQILSSLKGQAKVFVLAHEMVHAQLAWEHQGDSAVKDAVEMEMVVHCASEAWLEEMGVGGYRAFCLEQARNYPRLEDLRQYKPTLARISEELASGLAFELNEELEESL